MVRGGEAELESVPEIGIMHEEGTMLWHALRARKAFTDQAFTDQVGLALHCAL
jgi:hypothetical protein